MTRMPAVFGTSLGATALGTYAALQVLGRVVGSTVTERHPRLPGDHLVREPQRATDHAISTTRPRPVWPWLPQMG